MPPIPQRQSPKPAAAKLPGVLSRIAPIGFSDDDGVSLLLYGQSGSGKTTFWGTFPGETLVIVCSGGINSGEARSIDTPANRKRISQIVLQKSEEMTEVIEYARTSMRFKNVVLDHVSGFQDLNHKEILDLEELPAQKYWGMSSREQYGQCGMQVKDHLRRMLNLPKTINKIIIGQERTNTGKDEGISSELLAPTVGVATIPGIANWLNPACDYVVQMFKRPVMIDDVQEIDGVKYVNKVRGEGIEYCARLEAHDVYTTKVRAPRGKHLPPVLVDPDYKKFMAAIRA